MSAVLSTAEITARCGFARDAARRLGTRALAARRAAGASALSVDVKGPQDFVTRVDRDTELALKAELAGAFPSDRFMGEEFGGGSGVGPVWVVDPIDGTSNFIRGLNHWGVSMALVDDGAVQAAVVYDAPHDALYSAIAGAGAFRNGEPIRTVATTDLAAGLAILGTSRKEPLDRYLDLLRGLHAAGAEHRRIGSAAIGLVRVAEGVADAYYEATLNSWDALGGLLIVAEAGGETLAPPLESFLKEPGPVLCGGPAMVALIRSLIADRAHEMAAFAPATPLTSGPSR